MKLCRFESSGRTTFGILEGNSLVDLASSEPEIFSNIDTLIHAAKERRMSIEEMIRKYVKEARTISFEEERLRLPLVPDEVWGAGVTYLRSREAREVETKLKGLYDEIYSAERPEIFLKGSGKRCVGPGEPIGIRSDSAWTVPEPELSLVLDREANVIGYTIANDVSARDIEGQNPLYLPQAKIFRGCCAIGPVITTQAEISNPHSLQIRMKILREGRAVFEGKTNTSSLKRDISELLQFLKRDNVFFGCTVFMTGVGIVPPEDFSLKHGDQVEIEADKIGILRNPVQKL